MNRTIYILAILLLLPACGDNQKQHIKDAEQAQKVLFVAVEVGDLDKLKDLLAGGVDPNVADAKGETALHRLSEFFTGIVFDPENYVEAAKLLISNGADIEAKDKEGMTPLHRAAQNGALKLAKFFISEGADVNATDIPGRTPLDVALDAGKRYTAVVLAKHGSTIKKRQAADFFEAAIVGDIAKVEEFLAAGADVNSRDESGNSALDYAALKGDARLAQFLIDHGADVNWHDGGFTALHHAVDVGNADVVHLLVSSGADIDRKTCLGYAPIHHAVMGKRDEVAALLLDRGCKVNITNHDGKTPLDFAETAQMKKLLLSHGAVSGKELKRKEE